MTSTPTHLRRAAQAQSRLNDVEAKAAAAAGVRDGAVLEAQEKGATYADLTEVTGLSTARITQILRRARHRRTTQS